MHSFIRNFDRMLKINWRAILSTVNGVVTSYYRWFVLAVVVLVGWFGWTFLLHGEYQRIIDSGILEYNNRVTQRETRQKSLEQLQQLAKDFGSLDQERLDELQAVLPDGFDSVALVNQMQAFASTANVSILSIDVVAESSSSTAIPSSTAQSSTSATKKSTTTNTTAAALSRNGVHTAVISMNVTTPNASYTDLKKFLDALEVFVPLLNLHNLTYSPETTSFALQLETVYLDSSTTR